MPYETILYETRERVATITLNRPERLNALSRELRSELIEALTGADEDEEVRCIILTGAGRAFSSGGDVRGRGQVPRTNVREWMDFAEHGDVLHQRMLSMHKPIVAAINGLCYGAALMLVSHCDIRLASDQAKFALIETRVGNSGPSLLPFLIGPDWTKRLAFTGDAIDSKTAREIHLVTEVLPHDSLQEKAFAFAKRVAAMPPNGVRFNKLTIDGAMWMMGMQQYILYQQAVSAITNTLSLESATPDGRKLREIAEKEGMRAYIQARDEAFQEPWP